MALKFIFNPVTGQLDWIDQAAAGTEYHVDKITLNATDISNKYVLMTTAPTTDTDTRLVVIGGIEQDYGTDFTVTADDGGRRLSWNALGLDGILADGDKLVIVYN